jgi:hypothetical protein
MKLLCSSLLVITGCFGAGPAPGAPSEATVLFAAPAPNANDPCNSSTYVSSVAVNANGGIALVIPYTPTNGNCTGGTSGQSNAVRFFANGTQMMFGVPGGQGAPRTAVAFNDPQAVYAYSGGSQLSVGTVTGTSSGVTTISNVNAGNVVGVVFDPNMVFVATISNNGQGGNTNMPDPAEPTFPCCGNNNIPRGGQIAKFAYPITSNTAQIVGTPDLFCDEVKTCLVGDGSSLYYLEHIPQPNLFAITSVDKGGGTLMQLDQLGNNLPPNMGVVPVGFDASGAHVGVALGYSALMSNGVAPGCWIFTGGTGANQVTQRFQTDRFACLDLALDDRFAYFTIVREDNSCGNCNPRPTHGDGIGRVDLTTGDFESIALGVTGSTSGPRHVFVDAGSIYAIDPLAIVRIPKDAIAGKHDFMQ